MNLSKNRPNCSPTHFSLKLLHNFIWGKSSPKIQATLVIEKILPKISSHPMDENSPNPVTLFASPLCGNFRALLSELVSTSH
jgi:hypothetical protein